MDKAEFCQRIGKNVCYVVAVVVIEEDKILMVQEAKKSCRGKWYLPAGRVEQEETFDEAAFREAIEESGLKTEIEALTYVEFQGSNWTRLTFSGRVVGGVLKDEPDKESLKAEWLDLGLVLNGGSKEYPLRCSDIAPCIDVTRKWLDNNSKFAPFLPSGVPHRQTDLLLLVTRQIHEGKKEVLVTSANRKLPQRVLTPRSVLVTLRDMYAAVFPECPELPRSKISLSDLEFSGRDGCGGCRIVFSCDVTREQKELQASVQFQWIPIDLVTEETVGAALYSKLQNPCSQPVAVNFL